MPFLQYVSIYIYMFSSVQFSHSVVSNYLRSHGLQQARLPCPSPTPVASSNSCPSRQWCHPTISSSVIPFSSHLQSFPVPESFLWVSFFASGDQSIGVSASASVPPMNIQDWFPLGLTGWIFLSLFFFLLCDLYSMNILNSTQISAGWISLQSKGASRVFPKTTVQKHQFFST